MAEVKRNEQGILVCPGAPRRPRYFRRQQLQGRVVRTLFPHIPEGQEPQRLAVQLAENLRLSAPEFGLVSLNPSSHSEDR